jgi:broad-specificity NMP kinase
MKRLLITGVSGTGKSAVAHELAARGYRAYDLDTPEWSEWIDADPSDALTPSQGKDWVWREDRVRALLSSPEEGPLFISGCAENMGRLFPLIDTVILLSAPVATTWTGSKHEPPAATAASRRSGARLPISSQPSSHS